MIADLVDRHWDVIVIGTGIGGGTIGRALAEKGLSVLFVEKGPAGHRAEETPLNPAMADPVARALRGFWPTPVTAQIDGKMRSFFAPLGSGLGGSSVFYAATLERPEPHDLDHSDARPHPNGGWPVSHAAMRPWYDAAEAMYHVCGEDDPLSGHPGNLRAPPPLSATDTAIMTGLRRGGLHPYRLHAALRHLDGCRECLGFKCPLPCKMDGRSAGVEPALATGRAALLDRCEVTALHGTAGHITQITALRDGEPITLRADRFVLAAGAFGSPRLLLASASTAWPDGCANASGLVGRNLMFHLNEMFAIWPKGVQDSGPSKSVGLRDLYHLDGQRFGMVQAMGISAGYGEITHYLQQWLAQTGLRRLSGLSRIPAAIAARMLGRAQVFVGLLEDMPYPENRITYDPAAPGAIRLEYRLHPELLTRRRQFRKAIRRGFRGQTPLFLTWRPELNFGHPCGTLRFGNDPATSVLDPDCRAHGIDNLHVVDASFFPTSMGVNPSLTIAANALRVAARMTEERCATI